MFTKNVGTTDKAIRVVVSLGLAFAAYKSAGTLAVILWVFAAAMTFTVLAGWCWLYALLGINTTCAACGADKPAGPSENKPKE